MAAIKISSKIDAEVWQELRELASETHQNVSGLLTEAVRDYLQRRKVRPVVISHLEQSIADNRRLGELLAG